MLHNKEEMTAKDTRAFSPPPSLTHSMHLKKKKDSEQDKLISNCSYRYGISNLSDYDTAWLSLLFILLILFLWIKLIYLFFWLCWIFVAGHRLPLVAASGRATLRHGARAPHCSGFSCCGARAPGAWASAVVAHGLSSCGSWALEHSLSSCGARAQLLHGTWDPPGPGLEPVSPAFAGGFLTTAPPGKSPYCWF